MVGAVGCVNVLTSIASLMYICQKNKKSGRKSWKKKVVIAFCFFIFSFFRSRYLPAAVAVALNQGISILSSSLVRAKRANKTKFPPSAWIAVFVVCAGCFAVAFSNYMVSENHTHNSNQKEQEQVSQTSGSHNFTDITMGLLSLLLCALSTTLFFLIDDVLTKDYQLDAGFLALSQTSIPIVFC